MKHGSGETLVDGGGMLLRQIGGESVETKVMVMTAERSVHRRGGRRCGGMSGMGVGYLMP